MSSVQAQAIIELAVSSLINQIDGGRLSCENEATLQLHLGQLISNAAQLHLTRADETFEIELEKPWKGKRRGRIDVWFSINRPSVASNACVVELKFFKRKNHREPNNRYDVYKDIARLERCGDVANAAYMLVVTDHPHYHSQSSYSEETGDFDFRDGRNYTSGQTLVYKTGGYGEPITLRDSYSFSWSRETEGLRFLLLPVNPST